MAQPQRRRTLRAAAALALLALVPAAAALYEPADGLELPDSVQAYNNALLTAPGPALVEFYVPTCAHCVALAPEMKKVARNLRGIATVAAVDCSMESAGELCRQHAVRSFPTLKLLGPDLTANPYTGKPMKDLSDYAGPRSARDIAAAVTELLHDRAITRIASLDALHAFAPALTGSSSGSGKGGASSGGGGSAGSSSEGGASSSGSSGSSGPGNGAAALARVLLFTERPKATVLAKALSVAYAGRLAFGQAAKGAGDGAAAALGVTEWPTVLLIKPDGAKEVYSGPLKAPQLRTFLDAFAAPPPPLPGSGGGSDSKQAGGSQEVMRGIFEVPVEALVMSNLTKLDADPYSWLLGVHGGADDKACAAELAAFAAAAKATQSVVKYGALSAAGAGAAALAQLKAMGVDVGALSAQPCALQLVQLPHGPDKAERDEYRRYEGPLDDPKALQAWLLEEAPDETVLLASGVELRAFMNVPLLPNKQPQQGRVLLFASKGELPPVYKALALNVAAAGARYSFGWVSGAAPAAFVQEAKKIMRIARVPALVAAVPYIGGAAPDAPPGSVPLAIQPFVGPLKYNAMAAWLRTMASLTGLSDEHLPNMPGSGAPESDTAGSRSAGVSVIESQQQLEEACYSAGTALCVAALLDFGNARHEDRMEALREAAARQAIKQAGLASFVAIDARHQPAITSALGVRVDSLPALAVISAKRRRAALAPPGASITARAVEDLLTGVLSGNLSTMELGEMPRFVEGDKAVGAGTDTLPSDGAALLEEEFDLSDVMAEQVDLTTKEEQLRKAEQELQAEVEAKAMAAAYAAAAKEAARKKKKKHVNDEL